MTLGTSMAVQWLSLYASNAGDAGSITAQRTIIVHAVWQRQKSEKF